MKDNNKKKRGIKSSLLQFFWLMISPITYFSQYGRINLLKEKKRAIKHNGVLGGVYSLLILKFKIMITENDYLKAKKIVEEYEKQQLLKIKRMQKGDIDLLTVLSERPKNLLIAYNEKCPEGEELIYVSDIVKYIKKDGFSAYGYSKDRKHILQYCLIKWRGMGYKSYDEIMSYVLPFL